MGEVCAWQLLPVRNLSLYYASSIIDYEKDAKKIYYWINNQLPWGTRRELMSLLAKDTCILKHSKKMNPVSVQEEYLEWQLS